MSERITTSWEASGDTRALIVTLTLEKIGDFDIPALESDIRTLGPTCSWRMALDMSRVQLLGSSGLAFLIWVKKQCSSGGGTGTPGKAVFFGFSDEIMGMLKLTKLTGMLEIVPDKKAAAAAIA